MKIKIDGINFETSEHFTILDVARFLGLDIPTLCYHEGLSPGGNCRLCVVEIGTGDRTKQVTSCTYPVEEGLVVYSALVEKGESLPFLIHDLETFYEDRGPEPSLQRVLGDAYARNGQLQKALKVYREALDNL